MGRECRHCDLNCRILQVDDDPDVADSQTLLWRCLGADARAVYDGETALAMILEFKPHMVVMDIGMPGMDGCETARRIRQMPEGKNLVLAALTAWGHDEARRRTAEAGFDHHFVKPLGAEALENLLASLRPVCNSSPSRTRNDPFAGMFI
ncbi:response regulator [Methylocystis heyeri]|uniref:Response regulator n=1 Tax=Methylocystis heyeri TaxID=391905 RepID=A0A6B8KEI0_9HYPH|nr:response regulator [Methylocystis heyeri]QGM45421.1 response regulator [Methylocystis heyeri]